MTWPSPINMPTLSGLLQARTLRFLISGGVNTLTYGLLSFLLTFFALAEPFTAHLIAYLTCIPLSYVLHRVFSFGYQGAVASSFTRFVVVNGACFAVASLIVAAFAALAYPPLLGTLAVMCVIPIVGYLSMLLWVFAEGKKPATSPDLPQMNMGEDSQKPRV